MRHIRNMPRVVRIDRERFCTDYSSAMAWTPGKHNALWLYARALYELQQARAKLKRAAAFLQPRAFVATYPNGSYVFDPEWSRARAEFHKKQGATIQRIRGVIEPW